MAKGEVPGIRTAARKRYWSERDAGLVVDAWRASGESVRGFARAHGIGARRLWRWAKRLRQPSRGGPERRTKAPSKALHFHPVELVRNRRPGYG
jgi:transposase-like protein